MKHGIRGGFIVKRDGSMIVLSESENAELSARVASRRLAYEERLALVEERLDAFATKSGKFRTKALKAIGWTPFDHAEGSVVLGHFFLHGESLNLSADSDDGVWKTILRTGTWKTRPGPGGRVVSMPLHVTLDGHVTHGHVSLKELLRAFDDGAVEHVTIPLSHEDRVDENTGLIKKLRIVEEADGNARLDALHSFSDEEVSEKVRKGSILNTSCGILFDYIRKRDGKMYGHVLGHVALTNKPWIDGMQPFGEVLAASSDQRVESSVFLVLDEIEKKIDSGAALHA